jgi:hypothetical protein
MVFARTAVKIPSNSGVVEISFATGAGWLALVCRLPSATRQFRMPRTWPVLNGVRAT